MSSKERKDPRSLSVETQFEFRAREALRANKQDLVPKVTQPFDAWVDAPAEPARAVPDFAKTTMPFTPAVQPKRGVEVVITTPPPSPSPSSSSDVRVSVGRVQGIGQRSILPVETPLNAAQSFERTVIAAGHRVPAAAPSAKVPVPAYPAHRTGEHAKEPTPQEVVPPQEPARSLRQEQAVTTCMDVKDMLQKFPVHMPELGGPEQSSSSWSTATEPNPSTPPPSARKVITRSESDSVEAPVKPRRSALMVIGLVAALGLLGSSFLLKRSGPSEPIAANEPASPAAGVPPPVAEEVKPQEARTVEPKKAEVPTPPAQQAAGSVTPASAAALYINGQYKEALAEYRLLSRAYPREAVYGELARILRRKLIDTCVRTQPNRQEACKEI